MIPRRLPLFAIASILTCTTHPIRASETVTVFSQLHNGYTRERFPDGTFKPEHYSFAEGGRWDTGSSNPTVDKLTFLDVARLIAPSLRRQNYLPATSTAEAQLLIMVYWGATVGSKDTDPGQSTQNAMDAVAAYNRAFPDSPDGRNTNASGSPEGDLAEEELKDALWMLSLANRERDRVDDQNARVLGYTEALSRARFTQHMSMGEDLIDELATNRYFVVLQAFDFPTAVREKKLKPLWFSRVSVHEKGDFAKAIERMAARASSYYGQPTDGLLRTRNTDVNIGKLRVVEGEVDDASTSEPAPDTQPASP